MRRYVYVLTKLSRKQKLVLIALVVTLVTTGAFWRTMGDKREAVSASVTTLTPYPSPIVTPIDYRLRIEKLSLTAPIKTNVAGTIEKEYLKVIESGVAHYAGTALPGETGNAFIFGHSSYYKDKPGDYKEIFKELNKLVVGDKIFVDKQGQELVYEVTKSKIVPDDDMSILAQGTNETITLMTCWPPGTLLKRYIVQAQRVNILPSPVNSKPVLAQ